MSSTRHNKLWITAKIKRLSRRKKRAFKKAQCSGTADDLKRYKDLQKEQHYECRKANQAYVRDTVKDNPKKLYSFIKWKRSDSTGISHLKCDGVTHNDPSKKATILNKQFTGMFTTEDTADVSHGWRQLPRHASLRSISRRRQWTFPRSHLPSRPPVPTTYQTHFLKDYTEHIIPALTLLFNASLQQGKYLQHLRRQMYHLSSRKATAATPLTTDPSALHQYAAQS